MSYGNFLIFTHNRNSSIKYFLSNCLVAWNTIHYTFHPAFPRTPSSLFSLKIFKSIEKLQIVQQNILPIANVLVHVTLSSFSFFFSFSNLFESGSCLCVCITYHLTYTSSQYIHDHWVFWTFLTELQWLKRDQISLSPWPSEFSSIATILFSSMENFFSTCCPEPCAALGSQNWHDMAMSPGALSTTSEHLFSSQQDWSSIRDECPVLDEIRWGHCT